LLGALGISLAAFRIAGGLLLFVIAHNMVFAKGEEIRTKPQVTAKKDAIQNIAVFPLAIPIIAGPGAISATIILGSKAANLHQHIACSRSLPLRSGHAWPSCCLPTGSSAFSGKPAGLSSAGCSE
jgi:multiple antibiotic resistance protein